MKKYKYNGESYDELIELVEAFVVELAKDCEWGMVATYASMLDSGEWDSLNESYQLEILVGDDCDVEVVEDDGDE